MLLDLLNALLITFAIIFSSTCFASTETFHDEDLRLRGENFSGTPNGLAPSGINASTEDLSARLRLALHNISTQSFNFRGEGQFTDISLPPNSRISQFTNSTGDNSNQLVSSIYQVWAQYLSPLWQVKLGRQELVYGNSRLLGNADWSILGRSFDALRFDYFLGLTSVSLFYSTIDAQSGGLNSFIYSHDFLGAYFTLRDIFFDQWDFYVFQNSNQLLTGKGNASDPTIALSSYGTRLEKKCHSWIAEGEGTFQSNAGANTQAVGSYQYDVEAGPVFDLADGLIVTGEFAFATKDFNQLFPSPHGFLGIMDFFSRRNIQDVALHLVQKFGSSSSVSVEYHHLSIVDTTGPVYNLAGTGVVASSSAFSDLGQEFDFSAGHQWQRYAVNFGVSAFIPGASLSQTASGGQNVYYAWISPQVSF